MEYSGSPHKARTFHADNVILHATQAMKTLGAMILIGLFYALHQDLWFWFEARPLVFGVLPIGLFYHAAFTVATSLMLVVLVRLLWPSSLDSDPSDS